jgi:cytochrome P450
MLADPVAHFQRLYQAYGPVSAWEPHRPRHVFAFGPEQLAQLTAEPEVFIADAFREVRMPRGSAFERLSTGLLRINGAEHNRHRRMMQPAFTARRVQVHRSAITALTEQELASWEPGTVRRIDQDLSRLVMTIAIRTIFDVTAQDDIQEMHDLITRLLKVAAAPATLLLPFDVPGSTFRSALRTAGRIEDVLRGLIRERRSRAEVGGDLLSAMIAARDAGGGALTDDELIGEAYTALCHESSAAGMTWTLFLLDQHPEICGQVVEELEAVLGGEPPSAEQLPRLVLLDRVIQESLRLLPPAAFALRYTARETALGPYVLPKDASVFYSPYVTHRIPELYERPGSFLPARWETARPTMTEYLPFGFGVHNCVGKHFAMLEMKIILAMILQRFRPSLVPGTRVNRAQRISLVPSHGLPMTLGRPGSVYQAPAVVGTIHESVTLASQA